MTFGPLVDAEWLRRHSAYPDVRVIDFRWYLQGRDGRVEYLKGHVPGAVFVDLEDVTAKQGAGRHPLPTPAQFEREMRAAGVGPTSRVVVYDDTGGSVAARLWFLLGYFGHEAQAILDGGLQAWGGGLETDVPRVEAGAFRAGLPNSSRIVDFDAVRALRGVPVIDARAGERYRGEIEPVDPKAGHIPGALSSPFTDNLAADGVDRPSCAASTRRSVPIEAPCSTAARVSMRPSICWRWRSPASPTRACTRARGATGRAATPRWQRVRNLSIRL